MPRQPETQHPEDGAGAAGTMAVATPPILPTPIVLAMAAYKPRRTPILTPGRCQVLEHLAKSIAKWKPDMYRNIVK